MGVPVVLQGPQEQSRQGLEAQITTTHPSVASSYRLYGLKQSAKYCSSCGVCCYAVFTKITRPVTSLAIEHTDAAPVRGSRAAAAGC